MIELRTPAQIEAMKPAGRFVAEVLVALRDAADVGVNLLDLDRLAHEMIKERGAESCYIDYHPSFGASPFGKVLCTSVNDAVLHGLPHDYALKDGDLLSLDFACSVDGWVSDSALSVVVGTPREEDLALIDVAARALEAGIAQAQVGNRLFDISAAIGDIARAAGLRVNLQFGGHGVGRTMHGDPHVPNDGRPGRGLKLKPGLVIAIEPWFLQTTDQIFTDADGWTLRSADGSRGAHMEHTVAITDSGPLVLDATVVTRPTYETCSSLMPLTQPCRSRRGLAEPADVRRVLGQGLEDQLDLLAGQVGADAVVRAVPAEGDVRVRRAGDVEGVGLVEDVVVVVGAAVEQPDPLALLHRHAAHLDVVERGPLEDVDRGRPPDHLVDHGLGRSSSQSCHWSGWSRKASMPCVIALRVVSLPATVSMITK